MKIALRMLLSVALTIPAFLVVAKIDPLRAWLFSDSGYAVLHPLFVLFGAIGVEGDTGVVAGVLLAISFVVAVTLVWGGGIMLARSKAHRAPTH